jgi:hypothetical protein
VYIWKKSYVYLWGDETCTAITIMLTLQDAPNGIYPHVVHLEAAIDMRAEPAGLPIAPWC